MRRSGPISISAPPSVSLPRPPSANAERIAPRTCPSKRSSRTGRVRAPATSTIAAATTRSRIASGSRRSVAPLSVTLPLPDARRASAKTAAARDASASSARCARTLRAAKRSAVSPSAARKARINIRRVVEEGPAPRPTGGDEPVFAYREQRPGEDDAGQGRLGPHAGKPADPGAAGQPHQDRLGLIVHRMGGEKVGGVELRAEAGEESVACLARPFL